LSEVDGENEPFSIEQQLLQSLIEVGDHAPSYDGPAHTPASSLLKFAGTWVGDDLEELMGMVKLSRSQAKF